MKVELITKDDLESFKKNFLKKSEETDSISKKQTKPPKEWLKSEISPILIYYLIILFLFIYTYRLYITYAK